MRTFRQYYEANAALHPNIPGQQQMRTNVAFGTDAPFIDELRQLIIKSQQSQASAQLMQALQTAMAMATGSKQQSDLKAARLKRSPRQFGR